MTDKNKLRQVLFDITKDCHCKDPIDPYCSLIEILLLGDEDSKSFIQIKCIEKFKEEISKEFNKDVTWNGAFSRWILDGYAKKFINEYKDDDSFESVYSRIRPKN